MFDEPSDDESPTERAADPAERAKEKLDEFRMHAELAAVFEGPRKFAAQLHARLDADVAREVQRTAAKLEKARLPDAPIIGEAAAPDAAALLDLPAARGLSTNDYHVHRRPGEALIVRWLEGGQVETFYERMQAHFDAALNQYREEERQSHGWKQDPDTLKYLEALDAIDVRMADRYLREPLRKHPIYVLSTQAADEIDILHLTDYVMGLPATQVVGDASAPPEDGATERDRAWFFKLFALRGTKGQVEQMCFFTFLQKQDDAGW